MYPTQYDTPLTGLDWLEYYGPHRVYHPGIDLNKGSGNQDKGQDVVAAKNGYVQYVHQNVATSRGLGKFVIILHSDGNYTRYAHLDTTTVSEGDYVEEGGKIGTLGNTGTTYAHLHFEVFGAEMATIQKNHWYKWRYYPSGKSKAWIQQYYINPWEWLKTEKELTEAEKAYKWIKDEGFVKFSGPKDTVTIEILSIILQRYHQKYGKK